MLRSLDGVYRRILEESRVTDEPHPHVLLLGFTVADDLFQHIVARDVVLPTQTHTFAWALVESVRAAGCPVRLLLRGPRVDLPRNRQIRFRSGRFEQAGVQGELLGFVNLLGLKHVTRFLAAVRAGSRALRQHGDDVLLIHGVHTPFLWFGALVAWRGSARVVPVLTDPPGVVLPDDGRIDPGRCAGWITRWSAWRCVGVPASWCSPPRLPRISRLRFRVLSWRESATRRLPRQHRLTPLVRSTRTGRWWRVERR